VDKDPAEASKWFQKAAEQGLAFAQCNLARCFETGAGAAKDWTEAAKWWRRAAEEGFPGAALHLGLCYYRGDGVSQSFEEAVKWFQRDAEMKHVGAQLYLGLCYWSGDGVRKDPSQAAKWWREAAIQGIQPRLYLGVDGSPGDAAQLETWWREVALRGNAKLQCCVAEFYHYGRGVAQDEAEALRWYRKAANGGDQVGLKAAAWLMATSDDPKVRDGNAAVAFAEKVDEATKHKDPLILDTLAAAYAEAGKFEKAVGAEKGAIAACKVDSDRNEFQNRLRLYETNKPFRASRPPAGGF
jgi:TPR repeat protein